MHTQLSWIQHTTRVCLHCEPVTRHSTHGLPRHILLCCDCQLHHHSAFEYEPHRPTPRSNNFLRGRVSHHSAAMHWHCLSTLTTRICDYLRDFCGYRLGSAGLRRKKNEEADLVAAHCGFLHVTMHACRRHLLWSPLSAHTQGCWRNAGQLGWASGLRRTVNIQACLVVRINALDDLVLENSRGPFGEPGNVSVRNHVLGNHSFLLDHVCHVADCPTRCTFCMWMKEYTFLL